MHDFASPPSLLFAAVHQLATDLPNADTLSPPQQGGANPQDLIAEVDRIKDFLQGPSSAPKSAIVGGVPVKFYPADLRFGIETLSAMKSLSQVLAGAPGNKALVWITSYSTLLLSDKTGTITEMIERIPRCETDRDKPTIHKLSLVSPKAQEASESLLAFRILAGSGVAVYPVRVGELPVVIIC